VTEPRAESSATIGEAGEKAYLAQLLPRLTRHEFFENGFGDDAAVIVPANYLGALVHKIDRAARPVALDYDPTDFASWGRMAVTANCSDILACGATPVSFMIAVLAPPDQAAAEIDRIILAADRECSARGIAFAGGDLKESSTLEVIGSAVGTVAPRAALTRNGTRPGDTIYCAGLVGGFAAANLILSEPGVNLGDELRSECVRYLSRPVAQWDDGQAIGRSGLATAAMDASDGLFDVLSVLADGRLGVVVDLDHDGYHPLTAVCEKYTGIDHRAQMFGAGDWNIVYAVSPDHVPAFERLTEGRPVFRIGEAVEGSDIVGKSDGRQITIRPLVHEHFRQRIEQAGGFLDIIRAGGLLDWS